MIKMYNAEVLSKFPVVQHFHFGTLFSWDQDPDATPAPASVHTSSQPVRDDIGGSSAANKASARGSSAEGTKAPWMTGPASISGIGAGTSAPWANRSSVAAGTAAPNIGLSRSEKGEASTMPPPTRAFWAK